MSSSTYIDKHVSALIRIHDQGSINDRDLVKASITLLQHVNNRDNVFYDKPKNKKNAGIRVAQNAHRTTVRRNPLGSNKKTKTPASHEYHTAKSRSKKNKLIASLEKNRMFKKLKKLNQ